MGKKPMWHGRVMRFASLYEAALLCDGMGEPKVRTRLLKALRKAANSHLLPAVVLVLDQMGKVTTGNDSWEWSELVNAQLRLLEREVFALHQLQLEQGTSGSGATVTVTTGHPAARRMNIVRP